MVVFYGIVEAETKDALEVLVKANIAAGGSTVGGIGYRVDRTKFGGGGVIITKRLLMQAMLIDDGVVEIFDFSTIETSNFRMQLAGHKITGVTSGDPFQPTVNQTTPVINWDQDADLNLTPRWFENVANTLPVIRFAQDWWRSRSTTDWNTVRNNQASGTFFMCLQVNGATPSNDFSDKIWSVPSGEFDIQVDDSEIRVQVALNSIGGVHAAAIPYTSDEFLIIEIHYDGTDTFFRINGGAESTIDEVPADRSVDMYLGSSAFPYKGVNFDLAEKLFWNKDLSPTDLTLTRTKLAEMYGVTLA